MNYQHFHHSSLRQVYEIKTGEAKGKRPIKDGTYTTEFIYDLAQDSKRNGREDRMIKHGKTERESSKVGKIANR